MSRVCALTHSHPSPVYTGSTRFVSSIKNDVKRATHHTPTYALSACLLTAKTDVLNGKTDMQSLFERPPHALIHPRNERPSYLHANISIESSVTNGTLDLNNYSMGDFKAQSFSEDLRAFMTASSSSTHTHWLSRLKDKAKAAATAPDPNKLIKVLILRHNRLSGRGVRAILQQLCAAHADNLTSAPDPELGSNRCVVLRVCIFNSYVDFFVLTFFVTLTLNDAISHATQCTLCFHPHLHPHPWCRNALTYLDLSCNTMGAAGVKALANFLKSSGGQMLHHLNLEDNKLGGCTPHYSHPKLFRCTTARICITPADSRTTHATTHSLTFLTPQAT